MGCDIHVLVEAKTYTGWHTFHHPRIDRWYSLFARMADVRNFVPDSPHYIQPIAQPRGLPEDVSEIARIYLADDGYHSHSWLTSEEWNSLLQDDRYKGDGKIRDVVPWEIGDSSCRDRRILDFRIVFAFDN